MKPPGNKKRRILFFLAIPIFFWFLSKAFPPIISVTNGIVYRQTHPNTQWENGFLSVKDKGRKDYKPVSNIKLPLSRKTDLRFDHDRFILRMMGFLEVEKTGRYWIGTDSDDGSWIWLNGKQIVDNGGLHARAEGIFPIRLTKGIHFLELRFENLSGDAYLDVFWVSPNGLRQSLPIRPHPFGRMISKGYALAYWFFKIAEYWVFLFFPVFLVDYLFPAKPDELAKNP